MTRANGQARWASVVAVVVSVAAVLLSHCFEGDFIQEHSGAGTHIDFVAISSGESHVGHGICDIDARDVPTPPALEVCAPTWSSGWTDVVSSGMRSEAGRPANRSLLTALSILRL